MLKVSDLQKQQDQTANKMKEMFRQVYEECKNQIMLINKKGGRNYIFRTSPIPFGKPLRDIAQALSYTRKKLLKGGFNVQQIDNMSLLVRW